MSFVNFFKDKSVIIPDFSDHFKPTVSKVPLAEVHSKKSKLLSDNVKPCEFYNIIIPVHTQRTGRGETKKL